MLLLCSIPAIALWIGIRLMPESARWYLSKGRLTDAIGVLKRVRDEAKDGPIQDEIEEMLAALEGAEDALGFASGMAATDAILRASLRPGDHLVIPDDAYGGTFRLIDKVFSQWGIEHTPAPVGDVDAIRAAMRPATKLVWLETPTNPLLKLVDIAAISQIARRHGVILLERGGDPVHQPVEFGIAPARLAADDGEGAYADGGVEG